MDSPGDDFGQTAVHTPKQLSFSELTYHNEKKFVSPTQAFKEQQQRKSVNDLKIVAYFLLDVNAYLRDSGYLMGEQIEQRMQRISDSHKQLERELAMKLEAYYRIKSDFARYYVPKAKYDEIVAQIELTKTENERLETYEAQQLKELDELQQANSQARYELYRLKQEEVDLTNYKMSVDTLIVKQQYESDYLKQEVEDAQGEFDYLQIYLRELYKQHRSLPELEQEALQLSYELQAEKSKQSMQNYQIQELLQEISKFEDENKQLNEQIIELTEEAIYVQQDNDQIEARIQEKMIEITYLSDENMRNEELIQRNLIANKARKETQEKEIAQLKQQLDQQIAKTNKLKKEYEKQLQEIRAMCKNSKK